MTPLQGTSNKASGLIWSDLTYDIPIGGRHQRKAEDRDVEKDKESQEADPGHKRILNSLSGSVAQGEFVGLLGASGAGKTTLLNALSARIDSKGRLSGKVTYQGQKRDPATWKRSTGYVEQDDAQLPLLTVKETLSYSARLRLPSSTFDSAAKNRRIEEVVAMLRLEECSDSYIGSATKRGISGGERKRASIGTELVSDVSLLFLDEPTSGLDAYAAFRLVDNLREIVRQRQLACLMTIHQPSWKIFCLLDKVMLLARGGIYYCGPPGEIVQYFSSIGFEVPRGTNPADHFVTLAENFENNDEGSRRISTLLSAWAEHCKREPKASHDTLTPVQVVPEQSETVASTANKGAWPSSWFSEFGLLSYRSYLAIVRDRQTIYANIGQTVVTLILVGFTFFRLGHSQTAILARIGLLFFVPINASFGVIFPLVTQFPQQRAVMIRERSSGLYRASSFYLGKLVVEVPNGLLQKVLFYVILYWMAGLKAEAGAFFIFLGINFVYLISAVALGLFVGAISPSIEIANLLSPLVNLVFLLFGGNLIPSPPPWVVWIRWISPITYTYSALSVNEFRGQTFECAAGSAQCYQNGEDVINAYNFGTFTIAQDAGFILAIAFVFAILGYLGLRFTAKRRFRY